MLDLNLTKRYPYHIQFAIIYLFTNVQGEKKGIVQITIFHLSLSEFDLLQTYSVSLFNEPDIANVNAINLDNLSQKIIAIRREDGAETTSGGEAISIVEEKENQLLKGIHYFALNF